MLILVLILFLSCFAYLVMTSTVNATPNDHLTMHLHSPPLTDRRFLGHRSRLRKVFR